MPLRLQDTHFDTLINEGVTPRTKGIIEQLNGEEKQYLYDRIQYKRQGKDISLQAQSRKRRLTETPQFPIDKTATQKPTRPSQGVISGTGIRTEAIDPWVDIFVEMKRRYKEQGLEGQPQAPIYTPEDIEAAKNDPGWAGKWVNAFSQGTDRASALTKAFPSLIPGGSLIAGGITGDEASQGAYNIPTGALNLAISTGKMATDVARTVGTNIGGIVTGDEQLKQQGVQNAEALLNDLGHMFETFVDVPWSLGKAVIYEALDGIPLLHLGERLASHGITTDKFRQYMSTDPVGTVLFMLPWLKLARLTRYQTGVPKGTLPENVSEVISVEARNKRQLAKPPVKLANFGDTGKGLPEAFYELTEDTALHKSGDVVAASQLSEAGYQIEGPTFERRLQETRTPDPDFWKGYMKALAEARRERGGNLTIEEDLKLAEELSYSYRQLQHDSVKAERARREELVRKYRTDKQADPNLPPEEQKRVAELNALDLEQKEIIAKLNEEQRRLESLRQPGDPITPEEVLQSIANYPQNYELAQQSLRTKIGRPTLTTGENTQMRALYDEAELALPNLSRTDIKSLNRQFANKYKLEGIEELEASTKWLVEQISTARAKRGQPSLPITVPTGEFSNTKLLRLRMLGDRLSKFYTEELKSSEQNLPKVTQPTEPPQVKSPEQVGEVTPSPSTVTSKVAKGGATAAAKVSSKVDTPPSSYLTPGQYLGKYYPGKVEGTARSRAAGELLKKYPNYFKNYFAAITYINETHNPNIGKPKAIAQDAITPPTPPDVMSITSGTDKTKPTLTATTTTWPTAKLSDRAKPIIEDFATTTDEALGPVDSSMLRKELSTIMGVSPHAPGTAIFQGFLSSTTYNTILSLINYFQGNTSKRSLDFTRPAMTRLHRLRGIKALKLATHFTEAYSAETTRVVLGKFVHDRLMNIFAEGASKYKKDPLTIGRSKLFVRFINSEKAKAVELRQTAEKLELQNLMNKPSLKKWERKYITELINKISTHQNVKSLLLNPADEVAMQSPIMQRAVKTWIHEFQKPYLENTYAGSAGIDKRLNTPSGIYAATLWESILDKPFDGVQGGTLGRRSKSRSRQALRFEGGAPSNIYELHAQGLANPVENLREIIHFTLSRVNDATKNRVIDTLHEFDYYQRKGWGHHPGETVTYNGYNTKLRQIHIVDALKKEFGKRDKETLLVPEEVADAWAKYVNTTTSTSHIPGADKVANLVTGLALLVPSEAVMHTLGVYTAVLDTIGKYGVGAARGASPLAQTFYNLTLPGRMVGLTLDMLSTRGPELQHLVQRMAKAGALRGSQLDPLIKHSERGVLGESAALMHETPLISHLREWAFGMPHLEGKGFKKFRGMETLLRAALWRAIEYSDRGAFVDSLKKGRTPKGRLTDAQIAEIINNKIGTYVKGLEPGLVKALKTVNPFARASVTLTKTGINALGDTALAPERMVQDIIKYGRTGEVPSMSNYRNAIMYISTAVGVIYLIKQLDAQRPPDAHSANEPDGGRFPWDIPGLKTGDIPIWSNGKRIDIPFRLWLNPLYRGFNVTGLRNAVDAYNQGERTADGLISETTRGWFNYLASQAGPALRGLIGAATGGKAPYIMPGGNLYQATPEQTTGSPTEYLGIPLGPFGKVGQSVKAGIKVMTPSTDKWDESFSRSTKPHPETAPWKQIAFALKLAGLDPDIRPPRYEFQAYGALPRRRRGEMYEVSRQLVYELGNVPVEDRREYLTEKLKQRSRPEEQLHLFQLVMQQLSRLPSSYTKSQVDRMLMEQGMPAPYALPK